MLVVQLSASRGHLHETATGQKRTLATDRFRPMLPVTTRCKGFRANAFTIRKMVEARLSFARRRCGCIYFAGEFQFRGLRLFACSLDKKFDTQVFGVRACNDIIMVWLEWMLEHVIFVIPILHCPDPLYGYS